MNVQEAIDNALRFLEALGYEGGDIHDDLREALHVLCDYYPDVAEEPL